MSHYTEQREADEKPDWSKAPNGATHYGDGRYWMDSSFGFVSVWSWYDKFSNRWKASNESPVGHHDFTLRPQTHTKPHRNAQDELKQPDPVNHPKHYTIAPGVEAIDIIKASLTPEQFEGYLLGNFLKYRLRAGDKDDLHQDIAKSNWYRERLNR